MLRTKVIKISLLFLWIYNQRIFNNCKTKKYTICSHVEYLKQYTKDIVYSFFNKYNLDIVWINKITKNFNIISF